MRIMPVNHGFRWRAWAQAHRAFVEARVERPPRVPFVRVQRAGHRLGEHLPQFGQAGAADRALTKTRGARAAAALDQVAQARGRAPGSSLSSLLKTSTCGMRPASISSSTRSTSAICSSSTGLAQSTTCSSRSASAASCSVASKASTSRAAGRG